MRIGNFYALKMGTDFISGKSHDRKTGAYNSIYGKDILLNKTQVPPPANPATPARPTTPARPKSEHNRPAKLSQNAQNALLEAKARRAEIDSKAALTRNETAGRGGLEPTRYDDWEIKGIASDF